MTGPLSGDESGVWWDGVLNPMSTAGIRAAMAEEDEAAVKASDIRWVAWPGYGPQVHVSAVAELKQAWANLEARRLKRRLPLLLFSLAMMAKEWFIRPHGWEWNLVVAFTIVGVVALADVIWSLSRLWRDPAAWGASKSRSDARSAGVKPGTMVGKD